MPSSNETAQPNESEPEVGEEAAREGLEKPSLDIRGLNGAAGDGAEVAAAARPARPFGIMAAAAGGSVTSMVSAGDDLAAG